jgi:TRAP-type C4-dicarboxylate transport system substrate-binding protein
MSFPDIRRTATTAAAIAAVVATLAAGCGADGSTKAGRSNGRVVLRMASPAADLGFEPAIAYFVDRVRALSRGAVRIEVVNAWGGSGPSAEQQVVRDVARDRADLGWAGTRVFDTLGVRSFQALTAPLLIDSYGLERAVISSDIPRRMLRGLGTVGVTGLAVLGDGLRKPIAVTRPLLAPADWRGTRFGTFRSRGQAAAIRALGATPVESWGARLEEDLFRGRVQGFEKNLLVYGRNAMERQARYITANVNLWPQTLALFGSPTRLGKLTSEQRRVVERAADDAAARSTGFFDRDNRLAPALCAAGARFAEASPAQVAALTRGLGHVYATLERDRQTRSFVAQIERVKQSTDPGAPLAIPAGCASPSRTRSAAAGAGAGAGRIPAGVYRIAWTSKALLAAGLRREYARGNHGVVTLALRRGRYRVQFAGERGPPCTGTYTDRRRTFSIDFYVPTCKGGVGVVVATWSVLPRGDLRFHVLQATDAGDEVFWGAKAWRKIG